MFTTIGEPQILCYRAARTLAPNMNEPHHFDPAATTSGPPWRQGFSLLGEGFFSELAPQPLQNPYWVGRNPALQRELGLSQSWMDREQTLQALAGNALLPGTCLRASVYSGHQFGQWAGQLGDGRALLLGDLPDLAGKRQELQLKGAGPTPYSRRGDGRAVLRSSIREFLCSEAMHGLGIATSRALCITGSDDRVYREQIETAAVVTRVAPSFIRFGHFEHFSYKADAKGSNPPHAELQRLADHVLEHHYPQCRDSQTFPGQPYAALLHAVTQRTARLMAQWQAVGFCHGVMNTDNMSMLGLTIDYGPFQFLDAFDPAHVCNHSDTQGRYAYQRQPAVAHWNLFCLGQALLPLIQDQDRALAALQSYESEFDATWRALMRAKLGLNNGLAEDAQRIDSILALLAQDGVDYTIFWRRLSHWVVRMEAADDSVRDLFLNRRAIDAWLLDYAKRIPVPERSQAASLMLATNPKFVLRNHLAQVAIEKAQAGDFSEVTTLLGLLQSPFDEHPGHDAYAGFPPSWASQLEISCSS